MNDIERQREHFEGVSEQYFFARQNRNHLRFKYLLWKSFFEDKRNLLCNGNKVLEPMCGYSEGKAILETHFGEPIRYTGFDFSRPLVDEAKLRYPDTNIFVGDVTCFEASEQYDVIILIGGLHHVYAHTKDVLDRITSALKSGGYFINFEPTQNNSLFRFVRERIYKSNKIFDDETERAYNLDELNRLYAASGLHIVDQIYPGLLAYIMYYNPDAFPILNLGGESTVRFLFGLEKYFYRTSLARKLSFATLTLLQKNK
ncbi:class I SAM-dependent methyltransferase [Methylocaldum sp.]|uniref:class I SAM-dependent methyltransferase n=1 Tax=Methylocaldum sp. TaxID=1969727 RepID=UPI002D2800E6|nr:class I SAM-dependent methyltransferase [Methylocaldum sp.]HYE37791.1 class I SAM-dependent methyltransferase [Methylocaldum sp.]